MNLEYRYEDRLIISNIVVYHIIRTTQFSKILMLSMIIGSLGETLWSKLEPKSLDDFLNSNE